MHDDLAVVTPWAEAEGLALSSTITEGTATGLGTASRSVGEHDITVSAQPEVDRQYAVIEGPDGRELVEPDAPTRDLCDTHTTCSADICDYWAGWVAYWEETYECCPGSTQCALIDSSCGC